LEDNIKLDVMVWSGFN